MSARTETAPKASAPMIRASSTRPDAGSRRRRASAGPPDAIVKASADHARARPCYLQALDEVAALFRVDHPEAPGRVDGVRAARGAWPAPRALRARGGAGSARWPRCPSRSRRTGDPSAAPRRRRGRRRARGPAGPGRACPSGPGSRPVRDRAGGVRGAGGRPGLWRRGKRFPGLRRLAADVLPRAGSIHARTRRAPGSSQRPRAPPRSAAAGCTWRRGPSATARRS